MNHSLLLTLSEEDLRNIIESSISKLIGSRTDNESDTLLDSKEAASLIRYKETSIYGLVKRKKIPYSKVEGKLLFSKKDLLDWISKNQKKCNP